MWCELGFYSNEDDPEHNIPPTKDPVVQFTWIFDKNGKEIYEGDIVKVSADYYLPEDYSFYWFDSNWYKFYEIKAYFSYKEYSIRLTYPSSMEIVGNIYENPELLSN